MHHVERNLALREQFFGERAQRTALGQGDEWQRFASLALHMRRGHPAQGFLAHQRACRRLGVDTHGQSNVEPTIRIAFEHARAFADRHAQTNSWVSRTHLSQQLRQLRGAKVIGDAQLQFALQRDLV